VAVFALAVIVFREDAPGKFKGLCYGKGAVRALGFLRFLFLKEKKQKRTSFRTLFEWGFQRGLGPFGGCVRAGTFGLFCLLFTAVRGDGVPHELCRAGALLVVILREPFVADVHFTQPRQNFGPCRSSNFADVRLTSERGLARPRPRGCATSEANLRITSANAPECATNLRRVLCRAQALSGRLPFAQGLSLLRRTARQRVDFACVEWFDP
jgi:hypothetical protein